MKLNCLSWFDGICLYPFRYLNITQQFFFLYLPPQWGPKSAYITLVTRTPWGRWRLTVGLIRWTCWTTSKVAPDFSSKASHHLDSCFWFGAHWGWRVEVLLFRLLLEPSSVAHLTRFQSHPSKLDQPSSCFTTLAFNMHQGPGNLWKPNLFKNLFILWMFMPLFARKHTKCS